MFDTMLAGDIKQTLEDFRRSVDQLFSDVYRPVTGTTSEFLFTPGVEFSWTDDDLFLRAVLPGVTENDVKVTVQNGRLMLEGERKLPEGWSENGRTQLAYGKFFSEIPLPNGLDLDKATCKLHDGVLDIRVPVAEQMKPRQIPIHSGNEQKTIEASADIDTNR
jgi:HSP20 family protein